MKKICPRCNQSFDCHNDQILECWCLEEQIPAPVRKYLALNFQGCLCRPCIQSLSNQFYSSINTIQNEKI
jgi:hypothetical protein